MVTRRLVEDQVFRFYIAHPLAFADWKNPTADELNANPTNDPNGLIWNVTCALNTDGTTFDLDDPELDESLTFCQDAGNGEPTEYSATIVYQWARAKERWMNAATPTAANGFNVSTLTDSLLRWRGIDYFAILSKGESPDTPFAIGHEIKMAEVSTDWAIDDVSTGSNATSTQTFAKRSRLNWNHTVAA